MPPAPTDPTSGPPSGSAAAPQTTTGEHGVPARDRSAAEKRLQQADELADGPMPGSGGPVLPRAARAGAGARRGPASFCPAARSSGGGGRSGGGAVGWALRRSPDQTEFLVLRGSILGRLQRYREAEADLRRVLRLHPSHAPAQFELGLLLWRRGLVQEAAAAFTARSSSSLTTPRPITTWVTRSTRWAIWRAPGRPWSGRCRLTPSDAKAYHLMGRVLDRHEPPGAGSGDVSPRPRAHRPVIQVIVDDLAIDQGRRRPPPSR